MASNKNRVVSPTQQENLWLRVVFGYELSIRTKQQEIESIVEEIECDPENNELVEVDYDSFYPVYSSL